MLNSFFCRVQMRLGALMLPLYITQLKKTTFSSIAEMVTAVTTSQKPLFQTIRSNQNGFEIASLLEEIKSANPKVVVEIGSAHGGTFYMFAKVSSLDAELTTIDIPNPIFKGKGGSPLWKRFLFKSFSSRGQKVNILRSNSHDMSTRKKLVEILGERKIDFLFIDGDHSYEGVRLDFEMYAPLVNEGGLVAFHDIVPGPERKVGGVPRYWQEVKVSHDHKEFVDDWNQQRYGIGLLTM